MANYKALVAHRGRLPAATDVLKEVGGEEMKKPARDGEADEDEDEEAADVRTQQFLPD